MTGKININGRSCGFPRGATILDVARENGIRIPTLCHLKGTTPTGSCNICVVEVEGGKLVPACSTPAENGMTVRTDTPAVTASRKKTLAAFLASGNHNCTIGSAKETDWTSFQMKSRKIDKTGELCPVWGDCRLQELAYEYQVEGKRVEGVREEYPVEPVNPMISRDFSRCIRCGRCAKACNEVQVNKAIRFDHQALPKPVTMGDFPQTTDECVFCGECIQVCPVGALVESKAKFQWRPWETEKVRTTCPYCGVGCQMWLHVHDGRIVKVTGVADAEPNKGRLCVKGRFGYDFIHSDERLKTPLIREDNGEFREAGWDEALDLVANRFKEIIEKHGPDALGGVSCARSINEDSYQMQKLFRSVFKTNNIDHCART